MCFCRRCKRKASTASWKKIHSFSASIGGYQSLPWVKRSGGGRLCKSLQRNQHQWRHLGCETIEVRFERSEDGVRSGGEQVHSILGSTSTSNHSDGRGEYCMIISWKKVVDRVRSALASLVNATLKRILRKNSYHSKIWCNGGGRVGGVGVSYASCQPRFPHRLLQRGGGGDSGVWICSVWLPWRLSPSHTKSHSYTFLYPCFLHSIICFVY